MAVITMKQSNSLGLSIISAPLLGIPGAHVLVENLLRMLEPLTKEIFVITGNYPESTVFSPKVHIKNIKYDHKNQSILIRIPKFLLMQAKMSYHLVKVASRIEVVFFSIGAMTLLLPMLTAKLLRKKTIMAATGSSADSAKHTSSGIGGFISLHVSAALEIIDYNLADQIVVESEDMIEPLRLKHYERKISANSAICIDFSVFRITRELKDRRNIIGYIGRLSPEKGVLAFAKAIPLILAERADAEFLIGGDGALLEEIRNELRDNGTYDRVEFTGWIPHNELPNYLNKLKLILAPSYTEGGIPNVIKEAMACGVPVLLSSAAAAGITKEDEVAFVLENNSPECIAQSVIQALQHPEPGKIIHRAHKFVEEKYSPENVIGRYRDILYGRIT